jgi:rod shape-determining protein MreC
MRSQKKSIYIGLLVIGLISPFIFVSSSLRPWGDHGLARLAQELINPIEYLWFATTSSVSQVWANYVSLSRASIENKMLKTKLGEMATRTADYEEQAKEITRLRNLLGFAQHYDRRLLVAEVMGGAKTSPFLSLRISRGIDHGVNVGMPVVTPEGVVGKIIRTGSDYSDLQLLTDPNFSIDVLIQRTRVRGVLRGLSGVRCTLNLNQKAEVRIGDTLVSSGIVGGFPKGLPVGQVIRISYETDNVSQVITIEPWVDYRRVEEVFVVESEDQELAKIVETAGFDWLEKSIRGNEGG